jgi:hypothetical protein
MAIESFSFDKGINLKKSPLLLEDGEMIACSGFSFDHDGVLEARAPKTIGNVIRAVGTVNGIHRYGDSIIASAKSLCPGSQAYFNYIYQRTTTGVYSNIDLLGGNVRPAFADYENFIFAVDGESRRAYSNEKDYKWGVDNPTTAPAVVAGVAGNPNGEYYCYATFYVKFPNDKVVETGPSPVATLTVVTSKIEWSSIPTCPYQGSELIIHRRLYRTVSGIAYLVATLSDNTTTTYSDNATDAVLQVSTILGTEGYIPPPDGMTDLAVYLQRIFGIKKTALYWTEPYAPFNFTDTGNGIVTKEDEDLVGLVEWGDQLFLASSERWYRLQGNDPETWSIRRTFTDVGIVNRSTLKRTKYGLIGLWNDGIYLFDGSINRNITEKKLGRKFFTDLSDLSVCYAEFDGQKYYFYYASTGSTLNSCIVIDFAYHPDYRIYTDDFIATAHELYKDENIRYLAKSGYEYTESGTETIATSLQTGDKPFGAILKRKNLTYLFYDLYTAGQDVTVTIYCDGTSAQTLTFNNSVRERKRSNQLKNIEGYRFSLALSCANSSAVKIYSPWGLEGTPVGD